MKYLIYLSTAVQLFSPEQLEQLLIQSRSNNKKRNLTGMLLYHDGNFIQVLEGDAAELDETYQNIKADSRHKNLIIIANGEHHERAFAAWSMGFHKATGSEIAQFEAYIAPESVKSRIPDSEHPAFAILKTFAKTNLQ